MMQGRSSRGSSCPDPFAVTSGGNASGNARTDACSWRGVLDFLAKACKRSNS